jgi:hypothetical protein
VRVCVWACSPLMPMDVLPAETACRAYSICTSFPEGLREALTEGKSGEMRAVSVGWSRRWGGG